LANLGTFGVLIEGPNLALPLAKPQVSELLLDQEQAFSAGS
jgi:hypothetical protein